ncbi:hypothetical protein VP1G_00680 [Cytospora mali]|uniref:DUF1275 domain protein n=1 Tax=Cytospora mali TaxID=578113 RepID=A0A194UP12_CYTMA|nr:hypothetical protein VP1G_00680 [Valsa mali var. pyri (nom. inval.)]
MTQSNGYGVVGHVGYNASTTPDHNAADEEQPLLNGVVGQRHNAKSFTTRIRKAAKDEVKRESAELMLILCYIITGLLDSSSISIWGSFVSMQTGNTVYIGLGLSAPSESTRWIKSVTSLGCFCIGSVFFSHFHRYFGPKRRGTLIASFLIQAVLCVVAASMVTLGPGGYGKDEIAWDVLLPISIVAFQACGQAVTSRALGYSAFTSVVLTSIYCDLFSDAQLFQLDNPDRNRRLGAPVMLLVGAVLGGVFARSSIGIAAALWAATVLKLVIVLIWAVWPSEKREEESDD